MMGLKQVEAAARFGVSQKTWWRWERLPTVPPYIALACSAVTVNAPPLD